MRFRSPELPLDIIRSYMPDNNGWHGHIIEQTIGFIVLSKTIVITFLDKEGIGIFSIDLSH